MENAHRCPACQSGNTRRYAIAYRQGALSRSAGGQPPQLEPPVPPRSPADWKARRWLHWFAASPFFGLALAIIFALSLRIGNEITGPKLVIPLMIGLLLAWNGRVPDGMLDEQGHLQRLQQYEDERAVYERLWACLDCGKTFQI